MTMSEELSFLTKKNSKDYKRELCDTYITSSNKLTNQNVGFIGANKGRRVDLGLSGLDIDFEAGRPDRVNAVALDPIGVHTTPSIDEQQADNTGRKPQA